MIDLTRRRFLGGLLAAPCVLVASNLMPLRGLTHDLWLRYQTWPIGTEAPPIKKQKVEVRDVFHDSFLESEFPRDFHPPLPLNGATYRPVEIGNISGIGPFSDDISEVYFTEPMLKPRGISVREFLTRNIDIIPSQSARNRFAQATIGYQRHDGLVLLPSLNNRSQFEVAEIVINVP
jgi:hypothetical protein